MGPPCRNIIDESFALTAAGDADLFRESERELEASFILGRLIPSADGLSRIRRRSFYKTF